MTAQTSRPEPEQEPDAAPAPAGGVELTELAQMRAVMHPARWRVLKELYGGSSLTATQAAQLTGLTPSAMSWHLQQLAKLGLVTRDTSDDGREHPWRAQGTGLSISGQPDAAIGTAMMRNVLADVAQLLGTPPPADPAARPWPPSYTHASMRLARDDAKALHARVGELVEEWERERTDPDAPQYDLFWLSGVRDDED